MPPTRAHQAERPILSDCSAGWIRTMADKAAARQRQPPRCYADPQPWIESGPARDPPFAEPDSVLGYTALS